MEALSLIVNNYSSCLTIRYNSKLTTLALPSVIFEPKFRGSVRNLVYSDLPGQPPRRQELRHSRDLKSSRISNASGDACERRDPCQHGGVCISTDDGPICECRDGDYEGAFCERASILLYNYAFLAGWLFMSVAVYGISRNQAFMAYKENESVYECWE
ncbi:hypothetical protein KGM_202547 [Danaus plexippus plexippus]|uniref:EGF-like domain-containing protein n=1 Tax=Danaus plexippus plexippus TaxID=278856 RepID=A0A212FBB5_DANPL|nr:hypothetical protein KGM_202547 [Danaus plexippus plexippus]